jgi:hypothetical protein
MGGGPVPPPSSTPPQLQHSGSAPPPQQNMANMAPPPQQPPSAQSTLNRQRKRIAIIDPTTREEVSVGGIGKPGISGPSASSTSSTPAPSDSSHQSPASSVEPEKVPSVPAKNLAAEFAAKVAAVAEGSVRPRVEKSETPPPIPQVPEPEPITDDQSEEPLVVKEMTPEVAEEQITVESSTPLADPTPPVITKLDTPPPKEPTSLSVTCPELRPCDEPLYEPVSPTPLPDSPCDEGKSNGEQVVTSKPSPFEEVINKKANGAVSGIEKVSPAPCPLDESGFEPAKGRKKKQSAASKRAALNSKPEKMGDLLDVFTVDSTSSAESAVPAVSKKSPTPEPFTCEEKEDTTVPSTEESIAEGLSKVEVTSMPTEELSKKVNPLLEESENHVEEAKTDETRESVLNLEMTQESISEHIPDEHITVPKVNGVLDSIPADLRRSDSTKTDSELEDGEVVSDEDDDAAPNETDGMVPKLKYNYKEDQWSPLNPEGKKQYDREFLICLQRDPLSMEKPQNLPVMEIVKVCFLSLS